LSTLPAVPVYWRCTPTVAVPFGVGMLHGVVGRDETGRRVAIGAIGPLWDGNEVWLIVAAAGMFAAFPGWYATMFSGFYLAFLLLLVALIARGVSFEFRGKRDSARWRRTWDAAMTGGSLLAPLLIGVALGNLLHGSRSGPTRSTAEAWSTCSTRTRCSPESPWCCCACCTAPPSCR
jgi:cytochrome d oxidase subunit CydB